jgi:hypothetical protein
MGWPVRGVSAGRLRSTAERTMGDQAKCVTTGDLEYVGHSDISLSETRSLIERVCSSAFH